MKKTLLAIASALILTGAMSSTALAQSSYYDHDDRYSYDAYDDRDDDRDDDYDGDYDGDYDDEGHDDYRYSNSRYTDSRYVDSRYSSSREDIDRDGVSDRYDRYDNRTNQSWDRNRDGVNDRYQAATYNRYSDNRYDRRTMAQRRYQAGRYNAPRGYRYVRYGVGSRLPQGYYGNNYYVDNRPYGLASPPRGYRWNRVGSDAYLVSITNGVVRQVMYSLFY